MSADDFQTKYASFMESMLKSAVAETTQLFETMVDELKAEISRITKENEDLRTRCRRFENMESQAAACAAENHLSPGPSDAGSGKCDTGIQCDLVPFRTMLVEQCQPLRDLSQQDQEHQYPYEEMMFNLQEHNYVTYEAGHSQMTFIHVKQEESYSDSSLQSALKEEEVESPVVCGQVLDDCEGSPQTSGSGTETEGHLIIKQCYTEEPSSPQKDEETTVVVELPCLGISNSLQGSQNQSLEPEHSLVISLAALKDDTEEESKVDLNISERGTPVQPTPSEKQQLVFEHHERGDGNEETDFIVQQYADVHRTEEQLATAVNKVACEKLKNDKVVEEVSSKSKLPVRRRRGRPPKKRKQKKILDSSADVPRHQEGLNSPSAREEGLEVFSAGNALNNSSCKSPQASLDQTKDTSFIITLSDQESANTALEDIENGECVFLHASVGSLRSSCSSEKQKPSETQQLSMEVEEKAIQAPPPEDSLSSKTLNTPLMVSLRAASGQLKERRTSVTLQDAMLLVEAMNQSSVENTSSSPTKMTPTQCVPPVTTLQIVDEVPAETQTPPLPVETQFKLETCGASPQITGAILVNETRVHTAVVIPKQQHPLPLSDTTTSSASSSVATQTTARSLSHPLTSVPSKPSKAAPHTIIIVPRSRSSLMSHKIAEVSSTQLSSVESTAAQNNSSLPTPAASGLRLGTPSIDSGSQKTNVTARKSHPVIPSILTTTSTDQQSGSQPHPKLTVIIPKQVSALASRKPQCQTVVPTAKHLTIESTQLISTPRVLSVFASDDRLSQKMDNTTDTLKSPKQTASASKTISASTETCSSLKVSAGPVPKPVIPVLPLIVKQKLFPVVRLTRPPFPVSTKGSVLVSRLCSKESCEGPTQEKPSKPTISPSKMPVLFSNVCSDLTETSIAVSVNTSQMSKELKDIQEGASLSSETCTILEEESISRDVQPSTTSMMSVPALVKSAAVSNVTESLDRSTTASEPTPDLSTELLANDVQEKQADALLQLTSIPSRDTSDPHSHMTKSQFLAQLAVSRIVQAPLKVGSHDFEDVKTLLKNSPTCDKKSEQKSSFVIRLRSHQKTQPQDRRTETKAHTESEATAVSAKKPRLEDDGLNNISPRKSTRCKDDVRPKRSISEPASVSFRRSKATSDFTPVGPRSSSSDRDDKGSKNKIATSVSPERSLSTKESASPKKTTPTFVSSRRSSSGRGGAIHKNENRISMSLRRSTRGLSPKKTDSASVRPRTQSLGRNGKTPKMSTNCRSSTLTKYDPSSEQIKKNPKSYSITMNSAVTEKNGELGSPPVGTSPKGTGKSTSAKKVIQDGIGPKKSLNVVNAMKLAKASKAKTTAKTKNSTMSKLQKSQLTEDQTNSEVKKCRTKGVWIPPVVLASEMPPAGEKRSSLLHVKTEKKSHYQDYPSTASLRKMLFKTPPIVSPLQPLAVIGRHLLKNQCGVCGRILSSSAALESHVSLHTGHRPFSCTFCGKSFPDSKGLKRHGRVHRNGRIHICQQCGKGFVYRFGLTKHLQMVHSRIKPFICQICNKGFFTRRDVEVHILMHTGEKPFSCSFCEKKFSRRVKLNVHLRWHKGEKRHWCPYCGKGFLEYNNLKRHKYIHTGEKPYSCPHCSKHFTQTSHLKKHVKNVHKIQ